MISGINHITLSVRNLDTSFDFYTKVLDLRPVARWYNGAYLEAGDTWVCLTVDPDVRSTRLPEYTHTAFTVSKDDFSSLELDRLRQSVRSAGRKIGVPGKSHSFSIPMVTSLKYTPQLWLTGFER